MKSLFILTFAFTILLNKPTWAQTNTLGIDSVIEIKEVVVSSKRRMKELKPSSDKYLIKVRGRGNTSLVSKVQTSKTTEYHIKAVEFFFNYKWKGIDNEGFYIKPLFYRSKNGIPSVNILNSQSIYFVGNAVGQTIYIDLSEQNLILKNIDSFFIGIEFISSCENSSFNEFNVTMVTEKKSQDISFIKGACSECKFSPFNLDKRTGLSLKYVVYYN
jgi:hypothetical protein